MANDIASLAAHAQLDGGYAVDVWFNLTIHPILKLWQGLKGSSNFFFSEEDAREARGAYEDTRPYRFAETLWRMAQVQPSATLSYREEIGEYVVDLPIDAAVGCCLANTQFGNGTVFQYYIPNWQNRIYATGRTFKFQHKAYR